MHLRTLCYANINLLCNESTYDGNIQDMSCSGMFIETKGKFAVGQNISVLISMDEGAKRQRITGEIVRTEIKGIGVKFRMAEDKLATRIKSLVDMI